MSPGLLSNDSTYHLTQLFTRKIENLKKLGSYCFPIFSLQSKPHIINSTLRKKISFIKKIF